MVVRERWAWKQVRAEAFIHLVYNMRHTEGSSLSALPKSQGLWAMQEFCMLLGLKLIKIKYSRYLPIYVEAQFLKQDRRLLLQCLLYWSQSDVQRKKSGRSTFFVLRLRRFCSILSTRVCRHFSWLAPIAFFISKHFKRKHLLPHFTTGESGTAFKRLDQGLTVASQ